MNKENVRSFFREHIFTVRTMLLVYAATVSVLVFTVWWQAEQLLQLPPPAAQGTSVVEQVNGLPQSPAANPGQGDEEKRVDRPAAVLDVEAAGYDELQPVLARGDDPSQPPLPVTANEIKPFTQTLVWPLEEVEITAAYGRYKSPTLGDWRHHAGLDIAAVEGTPVVATLDGQVIEIRDEPGLGLTLVVEHSDGLQSRYSNLNVARVEVGDRVSQHQRIAEVGTTASYESVEGPHLHWEVWKDGLNVDPLSFIEQP